MPFRFCLRRDLFVRSAPRRDALVASAAQRLIIHANSAGVTGTPLRTGTINVPLRCQAGPACRVRCTHRSRLTRDLTQTTPRPFETTRNVRARRSSQHNEKYYYTLDTKSRRGQESRQQVLVTSLKQLHANIVASRENKASRE